VTVAAPPDVALAVHDVGKSYGPSGTHVLALEGISQLKETIDQIKATLNPGLEIQGVVLTMHDSRTALSTSPSTAFGAALPDRILVAHASSVRRLHE